MPSLISDSSTVMCQHGGSVAAQHPSQTVKVGGSYIWTQGSGFNASGCTNIPQKGGPCAAFQWTTAATRVWADGVAVLLDSSQAAAVPNGTAVTVVQTQTRVRAQ